MECGERLFRAHELFRAIAGAKKACMHCVGTIERRSQLLIIWQESAICAIASEFASKRAVLALHWSIAC